MLRDGALAEEWWPFRRTPMDRAFNVCMDAVLFKIHFCCKVVFGKSNWASQCTTMASSKGVEGWAGGSQV